MDNKKMLSPDEIAEYTIETSIKKASRPNGKVLASAFLAGAYISFGAIGSVAAAYNLLANPDTYGLGKALAGLMFPAGLMLVLIAGGDLFTGNMLIALAAFRKKVSWALTFKNWALVWLGNLMGAVVVTWLITLGGTFNWSNGLYGGVIIKTAIGKVEMNWISGIASGILCNWIVCATVWMAYAAKDITGRVLTAFFGIFLFVCTGFEHSVANMAYLFAGFFNKTNVLFLDAAHKSVEAAGVINIPNIFINNLIPVTIGNIIGGSILVAGAYYHIFSIKNTTKKSS